MPPPGVHVSGTGNVGQAGLPGLKSQPCPLPHGPVTPTAQGARHVPPATTPPGRVAGHCASSVADEAGMGNPEAHSGSSTPDTSTSGPMPTEVGVLLSNTEER